MPWGCFGLVVSGGIVVDCAPIARKVALGKPVTVVVSYYLNRGAKLEVA